MIARKSYKPRILDALSHSRAVCLPGPRQCGKSTLAHEIAGLSKAGYFDLDRLYIVYPGNHDFPLTYRIEAVPLEKGWKSAVEFMS